MAISFQRYVDITSGVGAGSAVRQRDLIGRLFTTNPLLPPASFIEFSNSDDVGAYFGTTSAEYLRAVFYFGWISKNITKANKISFARFVDAAVAPRIYGKPADYLLASFTAITAGSISLTLGANTQVITGINLSGAASLTAVAALLQTAIRAANVAALFASATVSYDATRKSFNLVGGATGAAVVATALAGSGTELLNVLNWNGATGAILANGSAIETISGSLAASADASNNFGSFLFLNTLSTAEVTEAATWNDAQNVKYIFCQRVITANAAAYYAALSGISGAAITLAEVATEYPEQVPMMILAATDYSKRNSVQNYMFQFFTLTPSVTTNVVADTLDPLRINYYGRTQTAGQNIDFYQRGVLMGLATDPVDMNTYANELWLKDAAGSAIMQLLLALAKVSANAQGRSQVLAILQSIINQALLNGTISVGKILNTTQKLFIAQITGEDNAWFQIQGIGYWVDCDMVSYVTIDGRTEFKAVYTLVYSKDDVIRKVTGTHALI